MDNTMIWYLNFQVGLKSLLHQGLLEPEFYGLKKIIGSIIFQHSLLK